MNDMISTGNASKRLLAGALFCLGLPLAVLSSAAQPAPAGPATGTTVTTDAGGEEVVHLTPFQVTDQESNGYNVSTASTATRMNTPLIDIPQTVDIVTSAFWKDTDATSFDESYKYVSNAYVRNRNAGGGDNVNLRGFQTSSSIAVDGVLVGNQSYKRDMVGYDRLEIVKGPPSAVQGRAGGSGLFNYILKKPLLSGDFTNEKFTTGTDEFSDNFNRIEVDANHVLNASGTLAGRLAFAWQRSDDYIKFQHFSIVAAYPSFRWKVSDNTEVVMTNEIVKDLTPSREEGHGFADYPYKLRILLPRFNVPSDPITALHLPYNFNIAGPGENAYEKVISSTVFVTQKFNDHIDYRQTFNWRYNSLYSSTFTGEDNTDTIINSQYTGSYGQFQNVTVQGDLIARYKWRDVLSSATLMGYNYRMEKDTTTKFSGIPNAPFNTINIVALAASGDSVHYFDGRTVTPATTSYTWDNPTNFGAYAEEDVGFFKDRLILNASLRRDHDHGATYNYLTGKQTAQNDTQLTSYRYGFTAKILPKLAVYAVESQQADPTSTHQRYNGLYAGDPRLNEYFTVSPSTKLYEFGIKGEAFGGRLSFSADHWQMNRTGAVQNFLQNGTSQGLPVTYGTEVVLVGAESHGYEFNTYGSLTKHLSLIANYTRMYTSQQNSATPDQPGNRIALQFAPIWNYNTFFKYNIPIAKDRSVDLKFGLSGIGPFWGQFTIPPAQVLYVPHSQKNIDAGIGYESGRYYFDFFVSNIDNDPFLITRDQPPRSYRFSVSARF
jgi:outer membrane receptor for monomeric catechols